jgi:exosortase D (VPLPA-CTERM-specific)
MTLSFMVAYIYRAVFWKKAVIFLSAIPITVLMNSFRIGVIGVLVEYWGQSMAEGFLHDFEGWFVFMACLGVLLIEMLLLSKIGRDRKSLQDTFAIDFPEPTPKDAVVSARTTPRTLVASVLLLVGVVLLIPLMDQREEIVPPRADFSEFPTVVGDWSGRKGRLENIYLDALKLDDYILADYTNPNGRSVSFYVAYYGSQSKGESAHSPRSCLPGGGWRITSLTQKVLDEEWRGGSRLKVNRAVIKKGDYTQLVYYWFQGRGRVITNEYLVKWYLFWDALTQKRTDGALVRLTTLVGPDEDIVDAERRHVDFTRQINGVLGRFVPD